MMAPYGVQVALLHLAIPRQAEAATAAVQMAKANSPNATATRWLVGASTASS
jgi:hypothetical protein